jgi:hypothetical protein
MPTATRKRAAAKRKPKYAVGDSITASKDLEFPFDRKKIKKGTKGVIKNVWEFGGLFIYLIHFTGDLNDRLVDEADL